MNRPIILIGSQGFWEMRDKVEEILQKRFELLYDEGLFLPEEKRNSVTAIVASDQLLDREFMARYPSLRTIARDGTGYDNVDVEAARARNVVVTRVAKLNAESVSDFTLGLLLALSRGIVQGHSSMLSGRWERRAGKLISEMTVGIVGLGAVGQSLARKLHTLGAKKLLGWNRSLRPEVSALASACGIELVSLGEVMKESDAAVIAVALTNDTKHLINKEHLYSMKPTAVLVNTSRGAVVDGEALAEAVQEGRIGGAALDVFSLEPPQGFPFELPFMQKLIQSAQEGKNVILTPHNAWMTGNSIRNTSLQVARNINGVLDGNLEGIDVV